MGQITVSRELLRHVLGAIDPMDAYPHELAAYNALCAALEQPVAEPACKQPLQVHKPTGWVAHKNHYAMPVLFNPYTGEPRDVRDVQSDPQGVLIVPPGKVEMIAASPPTTSHLAVEPVAWIYQNANTDNEYLVWKKGTGGRNWRPLFTAPPVQESAVEVNYRDMYLKVRDELAEAQQRLGTCEALARSVMNDQVGRA